MAKKKPFVVTTSIAVIGFAVLVTAGFYYTGFKPTAQYIAYVGALTTALTVIAGKRLRQKKKEYQNNDDENQGA